MFRGIHGLTYLVVGIFIAGMVLLLMGIDLLERLELALILILVPAGLYLSKMLCNKMSF